MTRALAVALLLAACVTEDANVLIDGTPLTSCADVPGRTRDDQACTFSDVCLVPVPTDPSCCQTVGTCDGGSLLLTRYCEPNCAECVDDHGCAAGRQVCDANRCVACPDPAMCAPCPPGLAPLARNGCLTCACAPASECGPADPTTCNGEQCYPGMVCAAGCAPDDAACCANVCSPPGCPSPAPLGCDTDCGTNPGGCTACVTGSCECVMGQWSCTAVCGDRTGTCFQPGA